MGIFLRIQLFKVIPHCTSLSLILSLSFCSIPPFYAVFLFCHLFLSFSRSHRHKHTQQTDKPTFSQLLAWAHLFMGFSCGEDHFVSALKPLFLSPTPSFIKWVIGECVNRQESFAVFSFFSLLLYCTIAYAKQFYIFQDGKESEFPLIDETSATQQQKQERKRPRTLKAKIPTETNRSQEKVLLIHNHACNLWFDRKWFAKSSHDISIVRN